MPEVALFCEPAAPPVTLNVTVQLPLAGIVMPVKLRDVWPDVKLDGVVPLHVPPTDPPAALMFTSVSVKAPPVSAVELPFANVNVTVEVPPA
jgi:hypothetical protein